MRNTLLPVVAMLFLSACAGTGQHASMSKHPAPVASAPSHAITGTETAIGRFIGASDHVTTGHASVFRSNGKWYVSLASDFSLDGAPDPKVAFGADGFRQEAILGPLRSLNGAQVYEVPAALDVGDYNEIWVWCEQFSVPLGVARLTLT